MIDRLVIEHVGPILSADIAFGDLTVLVGPQATGKSVALQWVKLLSDTQYIRVRLKEYGISWSTSLERILQTFFGEGMAGLWTSASRVAIDGADIPDITDRLRRGGQRSAKASLFYVPAQRALTMREGWPRPFSDYGPGDPFAVRDFSNELRLWMEKASDRGSLVFPRPRQLKEPLRTAIDASVFHGFGLRIDTSRPQKRLVLGANADLDPLPFMVWSAGQREFVPLLLGLYGLMPPTKRTKQPDIDTIVIEEPEMGLHPHAISTVMLLVLELMSRGYRVILSTHSPHVLDIVWALRVMRESHGTTDDVLSLFEIGNNQQLAALAAVALERRMRVFYFPFDTNRGVSDISDLDPGALEADEAGWGGLTEFSGRVSDVVARVVSRREGVNAA
jgi:hypothetical protein